MQNKMRSVKILEEVLGYFLHHEVEELDISFLANEKEMDITVKGHINEAPKDLDRLHKMLNEPRKPEYDEYYWSLLGASGKRQEFQLLGSLVDAGKAHFQDGLLTVRITRTY